MGLAEISVSDLDFYSADIGAIDAQMPTHGAQGDA